MQLVSPATPTGAPAPAPAPQPVPMPEPRVLGTVVLTDADGERSTVQPIRESASASVLNGSFRDAVKAANDLVRSRSTWQGSLFNPIFSVAIAAAGEGAYALYETHASIHRYNPIDSAKWVRAEVTKSADSPLVAVVSRYDLADLRSSQSAIGARMVRLPLVGPIVR